MSANYDALSIEQVLYIHEKIIGAVNGLQGVRDYELLHSALERCKVTFAGEDLYPTIFLKAGALLHSMVMNHPFLDGNKRTGYEVMQWFLYTNQLEIKALISETVKFCVAVDNEGLKVKEISLWIKNHSKKISK